MAVHGCNMWLVAEIIMIITDIANTCTNMASKLVIVDLQFVL